jgi:hypothetical protein
MHFAKDYKNHDTTNHKKAIFLLLQQGVQVELGIGQPGKPKKNLKLFMRQQ